MTLGQVSGGSLSAGGNAGLYAVGDIAGPMSVSASRYVGVVTWGSAGPAPIVTVSGGEGADAWVFGDVSGTVSSGSGSASLTALGSALSTKVTGATDAYFFAAGSALNTTVSAGQHAGAVTLGDFNGSVTAGSDAWLLSEGSVNASLSANKDGLVYAFGSVTGGFSAGRDIGVITYGFRRPTIPRSRTVSGYEPRAAGFIDIAWTRHSNTATSGDR